VQDIEAWDLKGVTENAQSRDPAHVREGQGPAYVGYRPVSQDRRK
jgi:hypothetical protein